MKTRNITQRAVSVLFCLLLLCTLVPSVYASGGGSVIAGAEMEVGSDRVQVSYTAAVEAVAVAALYDGSTGKMRAVGTADAHAGSGTFPINLPEDRQEGDELRVFLLDRNSSAPLAKCWTEGENGEQDSVKVGETVTFGHYEQDNNLNNGAEDIVWRVLAVEGGKALLISEQALDCKPYNTDWVAVTWETCTLRTWLNQDFYNASFDSGEKTKISVTTVKAEDNPTYGKEAGNDTRDRIFLLSIGEACQYFVNDDGSHDIWKDSHDRACKPTEYAIAQGSWTSISSEWYRPFCWWWLRSPGNARTYAANVAYDGSVYSGSITPDGASVRPALWINLDP